ncbi:uncharacterized protein LOC127848290 [Dreissena polymorpha]|uniref:Peptidase S1 domain-containing protein n=1 Tax=Dreissena polymorpha TaxID=45954 RepID=A0A9D4DUG8_DREPO|nr:uncharacterized protein LOC127848290 [Dreissena polymorpha]XP_052236624.1 uncharacterized protein LOC127848290 [Dreissena polymorpha]KAH3755894.1 hypothetical protein DPMN_190593 [Dreissena polymorpha]
MMASLANVFADKETNNWFKACIALNITKKGLKDFFDTEINKVCAAVGRSCGQCSIEHLLRCPTQGLCRRKTRQICQFHNGPANQPRNCPSNVCHQVQKNILQKHRFSNPSWRNTHAEKWGSDHWEVAKCYLPPEGYSQVASLDDCDFNGLITILLSCIHFDNCFSFTISPLRGDCLLHKVRNIGRMIRHTANCKVTDSDLGEYFMTLKSLLDDPICLSQYPAAKEALFNLEMIYSENDPLKKSTNDQNQDIFETLKSSNEDEQESKENVKAFADSPKQNNPIRENVLKNFKLRTKIGASKESEMQNKKTGQNKKLYDLCTQFGRKSQKLKDECQTICKLIRKIKDVLDVYPSFTEKDEYSIYFIVSVHKKSDIILKSLSDLDIDYVVKQTAFDHSERSISQPVIEFQMKDSEIEIIKICMKNNVQRLITKHKYLSIVEGCCYKLETETACATHSLKYEPRLALYVLAKGYIPIDEDPFEQSYDGVRVAVREGVFVPFTSPLRMGSGIQRCLSGTLSFFIEHTHGLCCLTSAHVMLTKDEHEQCKQNNGHIHAFLSDAQVRRQDSLESIGTLVEAICKEGGLAEAGVEIALIQMGQTYDIDGALSTQKDLEFSSGKTLQANLCNSRCFKVGKESGLTKGTIINIGQAGFVRQIISIPHLGYSFNMYNQIQVKPLTPKFATEGDSGAPVFVKDGDGQNACIGIVLGGRSDGVIYVTPITRIIQELGITQLKSFSQNVSKISSDLEIVKQDVSILNRKVDTLNSNIEAVLAHLRQNSNKN